MKFLNNITKEQHIMPLHVYYNYGSQDFNSADDYIDIIYKDMDTGRKYVETIKHPEIEIWITKPEYRNYSHIRDTYPKTNCDCYRVHYKSRFKEIADILGISPRNVKTSPYVFQIDMDIRTFYLSQFLFEYGNNLMKKLSIGVFDIENDTVQTQGFPTHGECPIDAISFVADESKNGYLFVYTKDNLPNIPEGHKNYELMMQIKEQFYRDMDNLKSHPEILINKMHEMFDDSYGVFNYHILFFDNEIEEIAAFFQIVEAEQIDFLGAWNAPYDIGNLIQRPKTLGYSSESLIVSKKFDSSVPRDIVFKEDHNWQKHKRKHVFELHVPYVVSDMLVNYTGIRAGRGKIPSAKLNLVAKKELEDEKIDYSEYGNIKWFKYKDLEKFLLYNMKDTILLVGLKNRTMDFETLYQSMYDDILLSNEVFISTRMLENSLRQFFFTYKCGYVMGSNKHKWESNEIVDYKKMAYAAFGINIKPDGGMDLVLSDDGNFLYEDVDDNEQEEYDPRNFYMDTEKMDRKDVKFKGAIVLNPKHVKSSGFEIDGIPSDTVHEDAVDQDITSEYPSSMEGMNASNETLVGKVFIIMPLDYKLPIYDTFRFVDEKEERENDTTDISAWIMEQYSTGDVLNTGEIAFDLPSPTEMIKGFKEFLEEEEN